MLFDIILLFVSITVPVAAVSYVLIYWALGKQCVEITYVNDNEAILGKNYRLISNDNDQNSDVKKQSNDNNSFVNKWIDFGGGFYGIIALITYFIIEADEIWDFLTGSNNAFSALLVFDIGFFIDFIVDSFVNVVTAFLWPIYWSDSITYASLWFALLAAWFGYEVGSRVACLQYQNKNNLSFQVN